MNRSGKFSSIVFSMACLVWSTAVASEPGDHPAAVRAALGEIFHDEHVAGEALRVHRRGAEMSLEERFEFLSQWVLPSADHDSLRMQIDFTQSYPAPVVSNQELPAGRMIATGAELVAPAIDLVAVATELNRLDEIQETVEAWQPGDGENRKSRVAFLSLVAIAQEDFPAAETYLRELLQLTASLSVTESERGPEAVAVWGAEKHEATRELAQELVLRLYDDAAAETGRPSERWKRHAFAKKYSFETAERNAESNTAWIETPPLEHWFSVSRMTAESRGTGCPLSVWKTSRGLATHEAGHDHDYLYYASPLTGDFSVEADLNTFGYRDIHMAFGSMWAGAHYDLRNCVNADFRYDGASQPIDPPLTHMSEWMRVRIDVRQNQRTTYINGRKVFQKPHPPGNDPWLAIHSWWLTRGSVRNLRIIGDPKIPEQIELASQLELPGWLPYFDENIAGPGNVDWSLRLTAEGTLIAPLPVYWEFIGRRRLDLTGTNCESLVRYHRPIVEDGTIEYEFYYEPQHFLVHPVLDRLCFLLNPEGIAIHWITDGKYDKTGLDPGNLTNVPQHRRDRDPLPLISGQWNKASLTIRGDMVEIRLNEQLVFSRVLESTNLRTFGLFHFADQTEARVRNIRWRGEWHRELPQPSKQELADDELERLLGDCSAIPLVLHHNFSDGLPRELFFVVGSDWQEHVERLPNGIRMSRPGGNYVNYTIVTPMVLSDDFDVTVAFEDFRSAAEVGGESNVQLFLELDDEFTSGCFAFRKHYVFEDGREEQLIHPAVFRNRNGETEFSFFDGLAEESTSGQIRMARRGTTLHYLYAEDDSPEFRLIHSEEIGKFGANVRLVVGQHKSGECSVVWKSMTVRAQSATRMPALLPPLPTLKELDDERSKLAATREFDLAGNPTGTAFTGLKEFGIIGSNFANVSQDKQGLTFEVPGNNDKQWTAAGLVFTGALTGDFDVSLELDVMQLEPSAPDGESTVFLQTEFFDEQNSVTETKYSIDGTGFRAAETQLRRSKKSGGFDVQELQSIKAASAKCLRLTRRGRIVYQIFQESNKSPPLILGQMEIGTLPVRNNCLRTLVHSGAPDRTTIVRLRSLTIHAEKID